MGHRSIDLSLKYFYDFLLPHFILFVANICCNGKTGRYRYTDKSHFGEISTFATKSFSHLGIALSLPVTKSINSFFTHFSKLVFELVNKMN